MGEILRGDVSVLEDPSLLRPKELTLVEPYLEEAPLEELCDDLMMGTNTPSIGPTDPIGYEPLDLTLISSSLHTTVSSYFHVFHMSLGEILEGLISPLIHIKHT